MVKRILLISLFLFMPFVSRADTVVIGSDINERNVPLDMDIMANALNYVFGFETEKYEFYDSFYKEYNVPFSLKDLMEACRKGFGRTKMTECVDFVRKYVNDLVGVIVSTNKAQSDMTAITVVKQDLEAAKREIGKLGGVIVVHGYYPLQLEGELRSLYNSVNPDINFIKECYGLANNHIADGVIKTGVEQELGEINSVEILTRLPKISTPEQELENLDEHVLMRCVATECNETTHKLVNGKCVSKNEVLEDLSEKQVNNGTCSIDSSARVLGYWAKMGTETQCLDNKTSLVYCDNIGVRELHNLKPGTWHIIFDQAILKGNAICSATEGAVGDIGTPDSEKGQYCWCEVTKHQDKDATVCDVNGYSKGIAFVGFNDFNCENYCAGKCAEKIFTDFGFRQKLLSSAN